MLWLTAGALGQDAVDAAYVRGHFSSGDGVWRASDFGWFYYDLDEDTGSEVLTVNVTGRTAMEGDIVYSSRAWTTDFEYGPWGKFQEVAFLGIPYLAGYPASSFTDEISSLGKGSLRKVLVDSDDEYTLSLNNPMQLMDKYVLTPIEVSNDSDSVSFLLYKNGNPVYNAVVNVGGTFVYRIDDVPIILAHLSNAMCGENSTAFAEIDGIFQISDQPVVTLFEGGKLGNFKMTALADDYLEFSNDRSLSLLQNSRVPLTYGLTLVVPDSSDLAYYPEGEYSEYGIHEIRGPVFNGTQTLSGSYGGYPVRLAAKWNSVNYTNFYMDPESQLGSWNKLGPDDEFGSETLVLYNADGRRALVPNPVLENGTVIIDGFMYSSSMRAKDYDYKPWGSYYVIPFLGNLWFAGYDKSEDNKTSSLNLLDHEKIGRVLDDREIVQGIVFTGNYTLQEGYEVQIRDVDEDKILVQLTKDGVLQDTSVVASNSTYVFKKDLDDVQDMPIIKLHVSNVFSNGSTRFATIDAIFQISDQSLFPVESGEGIGEMQIVSTSIPYVIIMINDGNINLNRDSTVTLAPNMNIRVADNDTLRYYLYSQQYVVPLPSPPNLYVPASVASGSPANFTMLEKAAEIRGVTAFIRDSRNRTINSRDITELGWGSGEYWSFAWNWNTTILRLSDDGSAIMESSDTIPALLYLNSTSQATEVGVQFDRRGRISAILDGKYFYYLSREQYKMLNRSLDYDAMQANETERRRILKIEPESSMLQFMDIIDGKAVPNGINHTLSGSIELLEPHAYAAPANSGRYELQVKVENTVNAVLSYGSYFNVTSGPMSGVALGSANASAGEKATIALLAGNSDIQRRINISYNSSILEAVGISGNSTWKVDGLAGTASILMPVGTEKANLTFAVLPTASNQTASLTVTATQGLPFDVRNGYINIRDGSLPTKKSGISGIIASLFSMAAAAFALHRR